MLCLRNICINTQHKGDNDDNDDVDDDDNDDNVDDDDDDDDNNNNNKAKVEWKKYDKSYQYLCDNSTNF
jgi:hypothetical protein